MGTHEAQSQAAAGISRRGFLRGSGAVLALSLTRLGARSAGGAEKGAAASAAATPGAPPSYEGWGDVYRARWTWDRIAKNTHYVNCAYQRGCAWTNAAVPGMST